MKLQELLKAAIDAADSSALSRKIRIETRDWINQGWVIPTHSSALSRKIRIETEVSAVCVYLDDGFKCAIQENKD